MSSPDEHLTGRHPVFGCLEKDAVSTLGVTDTDPSGFSRNGYSTPPG